MYFCDGDVHKCAHLLRWEVSGGGIGEICLSGYIDKNLYEGKKSGKNKVVFKNNAIQRR